MWKIRLQKIVADLLENIWKLYMNGTAIEKFLAVLKLQKILGNIYVIFASPSWYFRENSRRVPLKLAQYA